MEAEQREATGIAPEFAATQIYGMVSISWSVDQAAEKSKPADGFVGAAEVLSLCGLFAFV